MIKKFCVFGRKIKNVCFYKTNRSIDIKLRDEEGYVIR